MRKITVSIHSTLNGVVTGPTDDPTNFMTWTKTRSEDVGEDFLKNFDSVDTLLLGAAPTKICPDHGSLQQGVWQTPSTHCQRSSLPATSPPKTQHGEDSKRPHN
jgi:hypothetical protein